MHLIQFLRRSSLIILIFLLLSIDCRSQVEVKSGVASIIEVVTKTKNVNVLWVLHYIVIGNRVYSGDAFHGRNFSCKIPKDYMDKAQNYLTPPDELALVEKRMDAMKFSKFKTRIKYIDTTFFWKSIDIPIEYIELPCNIESPDFFKFIYSDQKNGLCITKIILNKLKKTSFPKFFLQQIIRNKDCLQDLELSYRDFEKCTIK